MPLTDGQIAALQILASARDPESYVAGSTPLGRTHVRYSGDIDIFHDREERVAQAAEADATTLASNGYALRWERRTPGVQMLIASRDDESVKLEWVADSDFRFFPTIPDPLFGYMLHPIDLALNKAQAGANRRELRDIVDLVAIHECIRRGHMGRSREGAGLYARKHDRRNSSQLALSRSRMATPEYKRTHRPNCHHGQTSRRAR